MRLRNKLRKNLRNLQQVSSIKKDKKYLEAARSFLKTNFQGYKNIYTHLFYSAINGIKDYRYIPSDIFFTRIEPVLNKVELSDAISDKLSLDLFLNKSDLPETLYKIINSNYFNDDRQIVRRSDAISHLSDLDGDLVLKPAIDNGGGRGVIIREAKQIATILNDEKSYQKGSYVVQKKVEQHPEMAKFNPSSLNTCRVMTARTENEIVVLGAFMRIGKNDMRIDNCSSGGIASAIDKNGQLSDFTIDEQVRRYDCHPNSGEPFKNFTIPNYDNIINFCLVNHKKFIRFTFISWDIAINKNGKPIFIEYNLTRQSIYYHQIFKGPIFGEHTEYFVAKYREERKKELYNA